MIRIYIVPFLIAIITAFWINDYLEKLFQDKLNNQSKQSLLQVESIYNAVIDTYMIGAYKDYHSLTSNQQVMHLLQEYKYADSSKKNNIRGHIFRLLHKQYDQMKVLHVRQFHLHDHKGDSLLRFHLPYESGDSLIDLRTSICKANLDHEIVSGFEGGRVHPGYRYVFPLFAKEDHLGSVEFSISFDGIESKLKKLMPDNTFQLIMTKESSIDRVFEWHKPFFARSKWNEEYYVEAPSISIANRNIQVNKTLQTLANKVKNNSKLSHFFSEKESFSTYEIIGSDGYIINFFAFNNTDNVHAGFIVSIVKNDEILQLHDEVSLYKTSANLALVLLLLLLILLLKKIEQAQKFHKKLERFIDIQKAIVILTTGQEFSFANKSFFDFFGYNNIKSFKSDYNCICECFTVHNNFFSLDMVQKDEKNWIESLLNLPERKRIVSMLDSIGTPHAFSVGINTYDENTYVVNFTDISDTMIEKLQFEQQAIRDGLTNAYNRTYFKNSINTIRALHKEHKLHTGVIYFDIDHFKNINDTFGHDIGDMVLKELVELIHKNLRNEDHLIRWGGEEFIILLGVNSSNKLLQLSKKLCKKVQQHNFSNIKTLTCSFGIAMGDNNVPVEEIISMADKKLYEAKESGRNKVCF